MPAERRRGPRHPFYAAAEITEVISETVMNARTSELSSHGCYMDMLNPLPLNTAVRVRLTYNAESIEVMAHVIYSQPNMGMGLAFDEISEVQDQLLEKWMVEAQQN